MRGKVEWGLALLPIVELCQSVRRFSMLEENDANSTHFFTDAPEQNAAAALAKIKKKKKTTSF